MKPLDLTIWNCHQLRKIDAVDFKATVDLSRLTTRSKNQIILNLEWAWVRSMATSGTGLLTYKLLDQANVWFVMAKVRKWQQVYWAHNQVRAPAGFLEGMKELAEADKSATLVRGVAFHEAEDWAVHASVGWVNFYTLKTADHLPALLESHINSPEYKAAVAPLIDLVKRGGTIEVNVKPPNGPAWRG